MTDTTIKRKRVVIKASEWGAGLLLHYYDRKKCCLGFACLALGKSECDIEGRAYPGDVQVNDFLKPSSDEIVAKVTTEGIYGSTMEGINLEPLLGSVNDAYHAGRIALDQALPLLRQGFREAGFCLVYRADL